MIFQTMKTVDIIYAGWVNAPNGASTFVKELKKAEEIFRLNGIKLSVFSKDKFYPRSFENSRSIQKKGLFKSKLLSLIRHSYIGTTFLLYILYLRHAKFIVRKYLNRREKESDIVYFQELFTCYYYIKYRKKSNSKIYLTLHNDGDVWSMLYLQFPMMKSFLFKKFKEDLTNTVLSNVNKIGFVANTPRSYFCKLHSFPEERTFYVYNGIPDNNIINQRNLKSSKGEGNIHLICVGTLCERKNQIGILKSLALLPVEKQQRFTLTLVGDGEMRQQLEEYAQQLSSKINFIGNTKNVDNYLIQADCFILFSKNEGLPISIIEAMRAGLPIISTKIAGIPELVEDGKNGYLVEPNTEELANLLLKILKEYPDLKQMGKKSRKLFEQKFTKEKMLHTYCKEFRIKRYCIC